MVNFLKEMNYNFEYLKSNRSNNRKKHIYNNRKMKYLLIIITTLICMQVKAQQLLVNAGVNHNICVSNNGIDTTVLGGNPTVLGGVPPYRYIWDFYYKPIYDATYASDILDDTTIANPKVINPILGNNPNLPSLRLIVIDSLGNIGIDSVKLTFSTFIDDLSYCTFNINQGDSVQLNFGINVSGGIGNLSYLWRPNHGLRDSTSLSFWAKPDSSIAYYVTATDILNCSTEGTPYYYINVTPIGISEVDNKILINVFPNPTKTKVLIENKRNLKIEKIAIFDMNGKLVFISESEFTELDLRTLNNGLYLLELETDKGTIHKKIQKE